MRSVTAAIAALFVISCGGSNPSGPAGPSPDLSVHNTLNAADNRTFLSLRYSYMVTDQFGRVTGPRTYDDFVSTTATSIRSVSWQAGYCDPRFQVPLVAPGPSATAFQVGFYEDRDGYPATVSTGAPALHEGTYGPGEVNQRLDFELPSNDAVTCGSKFPASFAYYSYSVALRTPFAISAGRRYWLRLVADGPAVIWGWRVGMQDNSRAVFVLQPGSDVGISTTDLAFSLSR